MYIYIYIYIYNCFEDGISASLKYSAGENRKGIIHKNNVPVLCDNLITTDRCQVFACFTFFQNKLKDKDPR